MDADVFGGHSQSLFMVNFGREFHFVGFSKNHFSKPFCSQTNQLIELPSMEPSQTFSYLSIAFLVLFMFVKNF